MEKGDSLTRMPPIDDCASSLSHPPPSRIKRLQQCLSNEIDQHHHQDQHRESGERDPPGFDIALGLAQQLAEAWGGARHPKVEEVQAGQFHNSARDTKGEERNDGGQRVRQNVLGDDRPVTDTHSARGLDVVEVAGTQKFGTHVGTQAHPAKDAEKDNE